MANVEKESVAEFHNVRLVDGGDLTTVVLGGEVEGELGDARALGRAS